MTAIISQDIQHAVDLLRKGELVAIPTDTVYGLAADASCPAAVKKIYHVKGRPSNQPLIVHIYNVSMLTQWARQIPPITYVLAEHFWPGALTFILPKATQVNTVVTGGQDTIGLRCPNHPLALALLRQFGGGVAAPSANRFRHISPTKPKHVLREIGDKIALILDGGQCDIGIESTILDLTGVTPCIVRQGMISAKMIADVCQQDVVDKTHVADRPAAPGNLAVHYAPDTQAKLVSSTKLIQIINQHKQKIAVISRQQPMVTREDVVWLTMPDHPRDYAHHLYDTLRQADESGVDLILIEELPQQMAWAAITDRLTRAAQR